MLCAELSELTGQIVALQKEYNERQGPIR